jgi:autotransporter-associated beta strand protein
MNLRFLSPTLIALIAPALHAQTTNYFGTSGTLSGNVWSALPAGPYTSALDSTGGGAIITFGNTATAITGASITVAGINASANATITTAGGTISNQSNAVIPINVAGGFTLDFGAQSFTASATAGYIKNGAGTLALAGSTYAGGFTLNAGTVALGGVNAMGAGGALVINGGTIRSTNTAARDLTGKYTGGITIGGNFTLGDAVNYGLLTFSNTMSLGASTRTITVNGAALLSGVISGSSGVGLIKEGPGAIILNNAANTYSGATTINAGTLSFRTPAARGAAPNYSYGTGSSLGLGIFTGGFSAAEIQQAFGPTSGYSGNLAGLSIGDSNNISLDTTAGATTFSANIGPSARGLEKILFGANLTLTGANQYSGRTVVWGGSALVVDGLGNIADTSSNVGTNRTIDLMTGAFLQITAPTASVSSDKTINVLGNAIFFGAGSTVNTITHAGSITTETTGTKTIDFRTNIVGTHTTSGIISDGSGQLNVRKSNAGTWILAGANTHTGTTTVAVGTLTLSNSLALQNSTLDTTGSVAGGAAAGLKTTVSTLTFGGLTGTKNLAATGGVFTTTSGGYDAVTGLTLNPGTGATPSYAGIIANGFAGMTLTKSGAGLQTLTGINSYTGATNITGGTLSIDGTGSINTSSGVSVTASTLRYNSSTNLSAPLTFTSGTIAGTNWNGNLSGLTIGANQRISPGNSPGIATTGAQTWAGTGSYLWEINNATGPAGSGWDLLNGTGTLDITATSGSPFGIAVTSLTLANAAGSAANFSDLTSYNWLIADFASITGFAASAFSPTTTGFTNPFTGTFGVALGDTIPGGDNTQIYLTYTAVPEPSAVFLAGLGALGLLRRRR